MKWTWTLTSRQPQHGVTSFRTLSPQSERCHLNPNVVTSIRRCHFSQNVVTSVRRSPHSDVHLSQTLSPQNVTTSVRMLPPQSERCHLSQNVATSERFHLNQTLSPWSDVIFSVRRLSPQSQRRAGSKRKLEHKSANKYGIGLRSSQPVFFFFTPALVVMDALFTK